LGVKSKRPASCCLWAVRWTVWDLPRGGHSEHPHEGTLCCGHFGELRVLTITDTGVT